MLYTGEILLPSKEMLSKKHPGKDSVLFHHRVLVLTPVFSSKILIPPKETVKKIFCLCSPFERAAATIPYWNKEQFGWFHYSSQCHSTAQRFACEWFTTSLGNLQGFPGTVPSSYFWLTLFFQGTTSPNATQRAFHVLPLPTLALANPPWHLFSWKEAEGHF